jgi:RNA polymerase sigma factor (sigma-70 family)
MDGIGVQSKRRVEKDPPMGPPQTFESVYPELQRIGMRYAAKVVGGEAAKELVHDIGLRMVEIYRDANDVFRPPVKWEAYIERAIRNRVRDFLAAQNTRLPRERDFEEARGASVRDWMDPERTVRTQQVDVDYAWTLYDMGKETREIYLRVREDELTYEAVAAERGCTVDNIKYHKKALCVLQTKYGRGD